MPNRVAIIGIGLSKTGRRTDVSLAEMIWEAVGMALEDAKIKKKDLNAALLGDLENFDGMHAPDLWLSEVDGACMISGMKPSAGGTVGATVFDAGVKYVASGMFDIVLTTSFSKFSEGSMDIGSRAVTEDALYDVGTSPRGASVVMASTAKNLLLTNSVNEEQIARLRVKESECGVRNPYAHLRRVLTVEEIMESRVIAGPVRMLHCCPVSDGATAIILASEDKAKKLSSNLVWVADSVIIHGSSAPRQGLFTVNLPVTAIGPMWDYGVSKVSEEIYRHNGIINPREELDVIECYDPSTWNEACFYSSMHLCAHNEEIGKMIDEKATWPEGDIPVNPSGGVVCSNPAGSSGMTRIAEVAIQIRGQGGERQVLSHPVNMGMAVAMGGDNFANAVLLKKSL